MAAAAAPGPDPACCGDPAAAAKLALRQLARRHQQLTIEIADFDTLIGPLVTDQPGLIAVPGIGPDVAGQLLLTAGDNPHRLDSEAAFAMLCGVALLPASGKPTGTGSAAAAT